MASITTRTGKGSPLTNAEVDSNFTRLNDELALKEVAANKGVAGGYASLDGAGKVPSSQLPSFVDDVVEAASLASFPGSGETGKIYVALDTNKTYRWSGSTYVEISASPGSTDAVTEGSTNLYFTNARARTAISATGSLLYNSSTGVFSYTAPTAISAFSNDSGYLTGNQVVSLTGDATGSGATSITVTLSNSGVSAGTYGSSTSIPQISVDSKGRLTSVTNVSVSIPSGSLTFTGDVTGSGSTGSSTALTLSSTGVSSGTYTKVTVDAKGRVTSGSSLSSGDLPTYTGSLASSQVTTALGYTPPQPSGTGASGTWGISITGNAATVASLSVHNDRNNEANKIVRTDSNGYIQAGWINTTSGDQGTTAIDRVYASYDGYIRYYTPANFRIVLDVPTRGGSGASGTWGINISGTATYATNTTQSFANNWNTDFANTPAGSTKLAGDTASGSQANGPGGTWWFQQNMRHTNASNVWGVQVAWGWEDNANVLRARNVQGGNYGAWVTYLNSANYTNYVSGGTPTLSVTASTSFTAAANTHYVLVGGATTVTLPASPSAGSIVWITVANGRTDTVIARNGQNINSLAENMTVDSAFAGLQLRFADATRGWVFT